MKQAKLTPKQKAFADYYIETANASESARRAGYSEKTAHRIGQENMQKPTIRAYIDERMSQKDKSRIASQDEILELLTQIARGEAKDQVPIGLGYGEQKLIYKEADTRDRSKAIELLGKRYGMWTDRQEVTGEVGVTIVRDMKALKEAVEDE